MESNEIEALKLYTASVATAPLHSEELALAYANRAAVLFQKERYGSALVYINRVLKMKHFISINELRRRKYDCISEILDGKEDKLHMVKELCLLVLTIT